MHTNKLKKKEFTCFLSVYLINELKDCKEPTYAFSIWTLIQFIDFKLLQDKMVSTICLFNYYYNTILKKTCFNIDVTGDILTCIFIL